eukprot:GILK01010834.1.p1 GENE.GILK01010834.1~~GILK01010834.1.p1  ORF type:complete len:694 (-),score=130.15 GILK01010834.1:90-2171(-)
MTNLNMSEERASDATHINLLCTSEKPVEEIAPHSEASVEVPNTVNTLLDRGAAWCRVGRYEDGLNDFDCLLKLESRCVPALLARARIYVKLLRFDDALQDYDTILSADPREVDAWTERAAVKLHFHRAAEALHDIETAQNIFLSAVTASPIPTPTATQPTQTQTRLSTAIRATRGRALQMLGRHEQALAEFNAILNDDPSDMKHLSQRRESLTETGRHTESLQDLDRLIKMDPTEAELYIARGDAYSGLGQFEKALRNYIRAGQLDSQRVAYQIKAAQTLNKLCRHTECIEYCTGALLMDPENGSLLKIRGQSYLYLGKFNDAFTDFERVLISCPEDEQSLEVLTQLPLIIKPVEGVKSRESISCVLESVSSLSHRAAVMMNSERFEDALRLFDTLIKMNPNNAQTFGNRGLAYYHLKQFDNSLDDFNTALSLEPNHESILQLRADLLSELQRFEEACSDWNRLVELTQAKDIECLIKRGYVLKMMNRSEDALTDFNAALHLDPMDIMALSHRAAVHEALSRYDESIQDVHSILIQDPNNAKALVAKGQLLQYLGRFDESKTVISRAVELFTEYLESNHNDGETLYRRAKAYNLIDKNVEAVADLDRLIALQPTSPPVLLLRGATLFQLERYKEALSDFELLSESDPLNMSYLEYKENTISVLDSSRDRGSSLGSSWKSSFIGRRLSYSSIVM